MLRWCTKFTIEIYHRELLYGDDTLAPLNCVFTISSCSCCSVFQFVSSLIIFFVVVVVRATLRRSSVVLVLLAAGWWFLFVFDPIQLADIAKRYKREAQRTIRNYFLSTRLGANLEREQSVVSLNQIQTRWTTMNVG